VTVNAAVTTIRFDFDSTAVRLLVIKVTVAKYWPR